MESSSSTSFVRKSPTQSPAHMLDHCQSNVWILELWAAAFGGTLGPTYPWLRSTATNPQWGTNFGSAGATAVNQTDVWTPDSGFNTPFSLNIQLQWLKRYKVRLEYYYQQICEPANSTPVRNYISRWLVWKVYRFFSAAPKLIRRSRGISLLPCLLANMLRIYCCSCRC